MRVPVASEILLRSNVLRSPYSRAAILYSAIIFFVAIPICSIEYFAVQDGVAHAYNADLISKILSGGGDSTLGLRLNSLAVPNSTGHWILVVLLQYFSAIASVKILMLAEYAAFVAVLTWLRFLTSGSNGLCTAVLLAAVYGLNFFWFGGFFNFVNGLIGYVFSIAVFYRWRDKPGLLLTCAISTILLLTYLSHIVCFATAAAALFTLSFFSNRDGRVRRFFCVAISVVPSITLAIIYKLSASSAESLLPVWKWTVVSDSIFSYLRNFFVDPFIIISRQTIPFTDVSSYSCVLLSPDLWIFVSVAVLIVTSVLCFRRSRSDFWNAVPFLVIFVTLAFGGLFAPDNFGESNGSILRERLILCGLSVTVAAFNLRGHKLVERVIEGVLLCVLVFQIAAMWEYGLQVDKTVRDFMPARSAITRGDQIITIVNIQDGYRFHSLVDTQLDLLLSVGQPWFVWDNYEIGYSLFPVTTNNLEDRQFVRNLAVSHVFVENGPANDREETENRLKELLETDNRRFTKVIIWGRNPRVENDLYRWFDPAPIFRSDRVTVLRHR